MMITNYLKHHEPIDKALSLNRSSRMKDIKRQVALIYPDMTRHKTYLLADSIRKAEADLIDRYEWDQDFAQDWIDIGKPEGVSRDEVRAVESHLRSSGLSRSQAKRIVSYGLKP